MCFFNLQLLFFLFLFNINVKIFNRDLQKLLMKNILPFLAMIIVLSASAKPTSNLRKYIGSGYDVFRGDPYTDKLDPGFKDFLVFDLPTTKATTEDGYYSITDLVSERDISTCKFQAQTSTISGTTSYQNSVSNTVSVSGGFNGVYAGGSFSASTSWRDAEKTTNSEDSSIIMSNAQCQKYSLSISEYDYDASILSKNFVKAATSCAQKHNWEPFFKDFGTHFVWQVILGGRVTKKTVISNSAVGQVKSNGLDISAKASVTFLKGAGEIGAGYERNSESDQQKYSAKYSKSSKTFYLGGAPTKAGDEVGWANKVKLQPMPIKYQLKQHLQLFSLIPAVAKNIGAVTKEYYAAMDNHCKIIGCAKKPLPDKPIPSKYRLQTLKSMVFGGDGSIPFDIVCPLVTMKITNIKATNDGRCMTGIEVTCSDGVRREIYSKGNMDGKKDVFDLKDDQEIASIKMRTDDSVFYVKVIRDVGPYGELGATRGGYQRPLLKVPKGYKVVGIYGQANGDIKSLGFIYGKPVPVVAESHMATLSKYLTSHEAASVSTSHQKAKKNPYRSHFTVSTSHQKPKKNPYRSHF